MLKRIVTIQDVSCFGKCSSTVALPLISAMGVETAVIPTAVLSTHTGGFTGYTFRDLTADIPQIAAHWKTLQLHFDGIYTGYLGSREQVQIMADFFDAFHSEDTVIVVDPVMGDAGSMYAGFTPDFAVEMRKLCGKADVIAPNMTEVSLLLGIPYAEQCPLETVCGTVSAGNCENISETVDRDRLSHRCHYRYPKRRSTRCHCLRQYHRQLLRSLSGTCSRANAWHR